VLPAAQADADLPRDERRRRGDKHRPARLAATHVRAERDLVVRVDVPAARTRTWVPVASFRKMPLCRTFAPLTVVRVVALNATTPSSLICGFAPNELNVGPGSPGATSPRSTSAWTPARSAR